MARITLPESESYSVVSNSLQSRGLNSPWDSPGQNTGVGSRSLLQGIFPTQGSNPGLPHCRWILYQLSHEGSPRILEWVAYPFSSGSSWLRNRTGVLCIARWFFTNRATREAQRRQLTIGYFLNYKQHILEKIMPNTYENYWKTNTFTFTWHLPIPRTFYIHYLTTLLHSR